MNSVTNVIPIGKIKDVSEVTVDTILDSAKTHLKDVLVIGWEEDGSLYAASSMPEGDKVLWLLENTKNLLMEASAQQDE